MLRRHPLYPLSYRGTATLTLAIRQFIDYRKATVGLTESGEHWLRKTLTTFANCLPYAVEDVNVEHLVKFLAGYQDKPWRRHSFFRAFRTFFKWASSHYDIPNPMLDRWGNALIKAPKVPDRKLPTVTSQMVCELIGACNRMRDKALIAFLADTGLRRSEVARLTFNNIDILNCRAVVAIKGNREGYVIFGEATKELISSYVEDEKPNGRLFGLTSGGIETFLYRLGKRTGIPCPAHSFRRGFATELRRKGVPEMDIMELGRWSNLTMVQRYTRAYKFEDAAKRYKAIVT